MAYVTLVRMSSPFTRSAKELDRTVEAIREGSTLAEYLPEGDHIAAKVPGISVEVSSFIPTAGDMIAFAPMPGGDAKEYLRPIGQIGIALGSVALTLSGHPYAAVALAFGGDQLIDVFLPAPQMTRPDSESVYGWTSGGNPQAANNIPMYVIYGKVRIKPVQLERIVLTTGNTQRIDVVYGVAGHRIDTVHEVELNGTDADTIANVEVTTREGIVAQTTIPGFDSTYVDHPNGLVLLCNLTTGSPLFCTEYTVNILDSDITGLKVDFVCPDGLYAIAGSGLMQPNAVAFNMKYKETSSGTWVNFPNPDGAAGYFRIEETTTRTVRRSYVVYDLPVGTYDVKIQKASLESSSPDTSDKLTLENISSITTDGLRYPGQALIAVQGVATESLSGVLTTSAVVERTTVDVYDAVGTAWTTENANNPAWACYDLLVNGCTDHPALDTVGNPTTADGSRYGCAIDPDNIDYAAFLAWATECDTQSFTVNLAVDQFTTAAETLATIAQLGAGVVVTVGSMFTCSYDSATEPTYMFTPGNMLIDSYSATWSGPTVNMIETTFLDATRDYAQTTLAVRSDDFDTGDGLHPVHLRLDGCTDEAMAWKIAGRYMRSKELQKQTIQFSAPLDAMPVVIGDVVYVQHDWPSWTTSTAAGPNIGGRILSINGLEITLDKEFTVDSGETFTLVYRAAADDTVVFRTLEPVFTETTSDTVILAAGGTGTDPSVLDYYAIGNTGSTVKKFRITDVQPSEDQLYTLSAIEYDAAVYDPAVTPTLSLSGIPILNTASNVRALEKTSKRNTGEYYSTVDIDWTASSDAVWSQWRVFSRDVTSQEPRWIGDYAAGTTYAIGDAVLYGADAFISKLDGNIGNTPVTGANWDQYRDGLTWAGVWSVGTTYAIGDSVVYVDVSEGVYAAVTAKASSTGEQPYTDFGELNGSYWELLTGAPWVFEVDARTRNVVVNIDYIDGHIYQFAVCAVSPTGEQESPDTAPFATVRIIGRLVPSDVDFNVSACTFLEVVRLSWTAAPQRDVTAYEVRDEDANFGTDDEHRMHYNTGQVLQAVFPWTTSVNPTWYIRARNSAGNFSSGSDSVQTINAVPTLPDSPILTAPGIAIIQANWDPLEGDPTDIDVKEWKVYIDAVDGSTLVATLPVGTLVYPYIGETSTTYYVRISAVDIVDQEGAKSSVVSKLTGNVTGNDIEDHSVEPVKLVLPAPEVTDGIWYSDTGTGEVTWEDVEIEFDGVSYTILDGAVLSLTNHGFETGDLTGWGPTFTGYPATYEASQAQAYSGLWSYHHVDTLDGPGIQQTVVLEDGDTYTLSCWVYPVSGVADLFLHGGGGFSAMKVSSVGTGAWERLTLTMALDGGTGLPIDGYIQLRGITEAYFDGVTLHHDVASGGTQDATANRYITWTAGDTVLIDYATAPDLLDREYFIGVNDGGQLTAFASPSRLPTGTVATLHIDALAITDAKVATGQDASKINIGTLSEITVETSATGSGLQRVVIDQSTANMTFYDSTGTAVVVIDDDVLPTPVISSNAGGVATEDGIIVAGTSDNTGYVALTPRMIEGYTGQNPTGFYSLCDLVWDIVGVAGTDKIFRIRRYSTTITTQMSISAQGDIDTNGDLNVEGDTTLDDLTVGGDLTITGSHLMQSKAVVATYTALTTDNVILCTGTFTVTLYAVSGNSGRNMRIKNVGTGVVTVTGDSAPETIDDEVTQELYENDSMAIVTNGTTWSII